LLTGEGGGGGAVLRIRIRFFPIPKHNFFHPGSRFQGQKDPGSRSASKNLSIFNPKIVSKLLEIRSGIQDPGSKRHRILDLDPKYWGGIKSYDGEKAWSSYDTLNTL
jgi:hypothetical protein